MMWILFIIQLILIGAKVLNKIDWSWGKVLLPLWIYLAASILLIIMLFIWVGALSCFVI